MLELAPGAPARLLPSPWESLEPGSARQGNGSSHVCAAASVHGCPSVASAQQAPFGLPPHRLQPFCCACLRHVRGCHNLADVPAVLPAPLLSLPAAHPPTPQTYRCPGAAAGAAAPAPAACWATAGAPRGRPPNGRRSGRAQAVDAVVSAAGWRPRALAPPAKVPLCPLTLLCDRSMSRMMVSSSRAYLSGSCSASAAPRQAEHELGLLMRHPHGRQCLLTAPLTASLPSSPSTLFATACSQPPTAKQTPWHSGLALRPRSRARGCCG